MVCKSDAERGSGNSVTAKKKKGNSQVNSGVARWTVGSQVIKSVTQHHIKQQAGTNREDPPGRLADRHAGYSIATYEEAERREARKQASPPNLIVLAGISIPLLGYVNVCKKKICSPPELHRDHFLSSSSLYIMCVFAHQNATHR